MEQSKIIDTLETYHELPRIGPSLPYALLREACQEARPQVVPERLPCDLGKVSNSPGESPRALPEEGVGRAFLCDEGWRPLDGRMSVCDASGGGFLLRP